VSSGWYQDRRARLRSFSTTKVDLSVSFCDALQGLQRSPHVRHSVQSKTPRHQPELRAWRIWPPPSSQQNCSAPAIPTPAGAGQGMGQAILPRAVAVSHAGGSAQAQRRTEGAPAGEGQEVGDGGHRHLLCLAPQQPRLLQPLRPRVLFDLQAQRCDNSRTVGNSKQTRSVPCCCCHDNTDRQPGMHGTLLLPRTMHDTSGSGGCL